MLTVRTYTLSSYTNVSPYLGLCAVITVHGVKCVTELSINHVAMLYGN